MSNFPKTLIIGLGGLGSDIVVDVYKRFHAHSAHENDSNKARFLALDTDANEISARREIMKPEDVIQTSATYNITVGHFIDEIKRKSTVENWFLTESPELRQMTINDGAGQIRSVSRLAFSHAIYSGKLDRFGKVIDELLSLETGEGNNIEVHIVSSLAGGTGAGSFLQTAFLVREILSSRGIHNPKVWGYFMLADIFLRDPSINLADPTKTTNVLANSYACIKELNGIYEISEGKNIEFEYGKFEDQIPQINQNNSVPFDQCFLYDFENNNGGNLRSISNYKKQIEEFLYLNAFSPVGKGTRSAHINEIFNRMKKGSSARFGSTGISKIVYPVDNLLRYFASRRLYDNLQTTWLKIDKDFNALHEEWRINTNKGIIAKEPVLSEFFVSNVESLAKNGMGAEQAVFKNIWQSTKVIDTENLKVVGSKTDVLIDNMMGYLSSLRENDPDITVLSRIHHNDSFTSNNSDEANDRTNIRQVEDQLTALYQEVFSFIDDNKRLALEEIFTKDYNSHGYVEAQAPHRINTYLLEKEKALHPLAARYFFYELLGKLQSNLDVLKAENSTKLSSISRYNEVFDIKDDRGNDTHIETALEAYEIYNKGNSALLNLWAKVTGKPSELKEFKADYVSKSNRQARILKDYALDKLTEHVIESLIFQVKAAVENLESLFKVIPGVMVSLRNEQNALTAVAGKTSGNPSIIYVLSEQKHRDQIYEGEVAVRDNIFFPEDISRNIYEEIYTRTYQQITNPIAYAYKNNGDTRIQKIFTDLVVVKQQEQLRTNFADSFAGYNVIQAMRKEAELDGEDPISLMNMYFRDAEKRATPFGAKYKPDASKINSWALNKDCTRYEYLTDEELNQLLDNPGNAQNNAKRVISPYFDKTEIIREDSVMVLNVPQDYPKFAPVNTDSSYSLSQEGIYFTYYKKRIKEIQSNDKLPSPHLDKRWNNPKFFRNLGVDADASEKDIIKAFVYGLANLDIIPVDNHGSKVWGCNSRRGIEFLSDDQGRKIKQNDIRKLLQEALWTNERLVEDINRKLSAEIVNSVEVWNSIRGTGGSLATIPLIKKIKNFSFEEIDGGQSKNLISVFSGHIVDLPADSRTISLIVDVLIETVVSITGNKGKDSQAQAVKILEGMTLDIPESGQPVSKSMVENLIRNSLNEHFQA